MDPILWAAIVALAWKLFAQGCYRRSGLEALCLSGHPTALGNFVFLRWKMDKVKEPSTATQYQGEGKEQMATWRSWSKKKWSEAGFAGSPEHEEQAKRMALAACRNISMSEFKAILGRPEEEDGGHGSELYNAIINPMIRREMILKADLPQDLDDAIAKAYGELEKKYGKQK